MKHIPWCVVAVFAVFVLCLMIISSCDKNVKDEDYKKVRDYMHRVEPTVAHHAHDLAVKHHCLQDDERVRIGVRLDNLGNFVLASTSEDTYRKITVDIVQSIVWHCRLEAERKSGLDRENGGEELQKHLERELETFRDLLEMDRILNRLSADYPGVYWEFEELRPRMDVLLEKIK